MYVVIVQFQMKPEHARACVDRVLRQAQDSLTTETACRRFDVCLHATDATRLCLYEVYDDESAFQVHLASEHFRSFDEAVRDWVDGKSVEFWVLTGASPQDPQWLAQ